MNKKQLIKDLKRELSTLLAKKKRILVPIIGYLFIVFLFSTIYWCMFMVNSTCFLITDQFNKHLSYYYFEPMINLTDFHKEAKDIEPFTISEFCAFIKSDIDELNALSDSLRVNKKHTAECKFELDSIGNIADTLRSAKIREYKERSLLRYQQRIDSLEKIMEGKDSIDLILDGKYVELSHLKLDLANKNAEVCSYIVDNYGKFIPDSLMLRYSQLNDEYIRLLWEETHLNDSSRKISSIIRTSIDSFHRNRHESVGYWDFVYYSICVSTTVSFGDIAPNNGYTRFASIMELLLCIVLIGFIVSLFQHKN